MTHPQPETWSLYPYDPIKALPILWAAIITTLCITQAYQSFFRFHWYHFGLTVTWASTVWIAGFVCRALSVRQTQNIGMFIAQYVLILCGPPFYAASEYFILGRLMAYLPYYAPIHPGRVMSTFLLLSAVVESLTANGATHSAGTNETAAERESGLACIKAALILQSFLEASFFSLVVLMEYRCRKGGIFPRNVRTVCYVLYVTSLMMLVRCIVRTVDGFQASSCDTHAPGYDGYCPGAVVSRNEWFLWVFEVANITVFVALLAIFPPGAYLPRNPKVFLDPRDTRTERMGPGFSSAQKRAFWTTVVDPFNIAGIVTGKGHDVRPFWDKVEEMPLVERAVVKP